MDELPPLFQDIEFHERFRGYDPDEVDAYVDRVAKAASLVQGRLTELQGRVESAENRLASTPSVSESEQTLTRTLILAQRTADAAIAEAKEEAAFMLATAESEAQASLRTAQAEASSAIKEADEHASRVLAEAETDRRRIVTDAEFLAAAAASSERDRLATEVAELEQYRGFLHDDVEILETYLREQRTALTASIVALTDLVEQPETFRVATVPATSGIEMASPVEQVEAIAPFEQAAVDIDLVESEPVDVDLVESEPVDVVLIEPESVESEPVDIDLVEPESVGSILNGTSTDAVEPKPSELHRPNPDPVDGVPVSAWDEPVFATNSLIDLTTTDDVGSGPTQIEFGNPTVAEPTSPQTPESGAAADEASGSVPALPDHTAGGSAAAAAPIVEPEIDLDHRTDFEFNLATPRLVTAADLGHEPQPATAAVDPGPPTAPMPLVSESSLFAAEEREADADPFLAQLREAATGDHEIALDDDALSAFFDQDDDESDRSWFGKRR